MISTERFEKVNIDRLVPYARNARTHSKEQILQLRASMREFGFVNPVIVDKELNIIVGHGRIIAAKEEGIAEVPCVFVEHLTEAQKRAYILADNRLAMNAGWDAEMLSVEIADLQGADFDVSLLGFDEQGGGMSPESLIALLAFLGTCLGSLCGVMASNKLTLHRILQLEKKVEKHNNLMERLYKVEEKVELMEEYPSFRKE